MREKMNRRVFWSGLALLMCWPMAQASAQGLAASGKTTSDDGCLMVNPGKGLGSIGLHMSTVDLMKTGLKMHDRAVPHMQRVGPYELHMQEGPRSFSTIGQVRRSLKDVKCVEIAGQKKLATGLDTLEALAAYVGQCGPLQINRGATLVECKNGVQLIQSGGEVLVGVQRTTKAWTDKPLCTGYVAPGKGVFVPGQGQVKAAEVKPDETWCVGSRLMDASVVEGDVLNKLRFNTCSTERMIGGSHVTCPYQGVKMSFAGPGAALHQIESVPLKQ